MNKTSICKTLQQETWRIMNKLDDIPIRKWIKMRNLLNIYEFPLNSRIINRAYYKLWEIIVSKNLLPKLPNGTVHLCEAPGAFSLFIQDYLGHRFQKPVVSLVFSKPLDTYAEVVKNSTSAPRFHQRLMKHSCIYPIYTDIIKCTS